MVTGYQNSTNAGTILRLQAAVLSHPSLAVSAAAAATDLAVLFDCERVSIGLVESGYAKVVAASYGTSVELARDLFSGIAAAMDEAIEQGVTLIVPVADGTPPQITLAATELVRRGSGYVCCVPLVDGGSAVGALVLERASQRFSADEASLCEDIACLVGPLLMLKRQAEKTALQRAREAFDRRAAGLTEPGHRGLKIAIGAAALVVLAVLLVPIPYQVSAPARVEGSMQRVMVAPIDGFLRQVDVRPGDTVREGQPMAELAGEDLQLELRRRQSEFAQHENAYRAALGRADRTQLVINQARAAEAEAQLALVEIQIDRSRLRAPFDGVVLKGDLAQSIGAPVKRGEVLFTLAPNEQFRVIVEVDERDIAAVRAGARGTLALAAMPQSRLDFAVGRVLPVAIAGEGRNFFEVEALLPAAGQQLRPGLRGVARIDAASHSLTWIVAHRLWDWLRLQLWSLGL